MRILFSSALLLIASLIYSQGSIFQGEISTLNLKMNSYYDDSELFRESLDLLLIIDSTLQEFLTDKSQAYISLHDSNVDEYYVSFGKVWLQSRMKSPGSLKKPKPIYRLNAPGIAVHVFSKDPNLKKIERLIIYSFEHIKEIEENQAKVDLGGIQLLSIPNEMVYEILKKQE